MDDRVHFYHVTCQCGHGAYIALSRWLERDRLLARARCTLCGHRGASELTMVPARTGGISTGISATLVGLKVIKV